MQQHIRVPASQPYLLPPTHPPTPCLATHLIVQVPVCLKVDEEAPIRANTTILLGNLAPHLSETVCKRVMLNAFTRALKDSFPPARSAGLKVPPNSSSS